MKKLMTLVLGLAITVPSMAANKAKKAVTNDDNEEGGE